MNCWKGYTD